ncbi:hypothetical protein TNCV_4332831 [Trichonephila clavipes]|nr:hypothetical protein TNCV_4332831 [Trichonephila clavipes]
MADGTAVSVANHFPGWAVSNEIIKRIEWWRGSCGRGIYGYITFRGICGHSETHRGICGHIFSPILEEIKGTDK